MSDDVELLRAQLIQCTTAMREAVNGLRFYVDTNETTLTPLESIIVGLNAARGTAVDPDAIERFREGAWQKAQQEADRLQRELTAAVEARDSLRARAFDLEEQLHVTQQALVEARAETGFPNPAFEAQKAAIADLAQRLVASQDNATKMESAWLKAIAEVESTTRWANDVRVFADEQKERAEQQARQIETLKQVVKLASIVMGDSEE